MTDLTTALTFSADFLQELAVRQERSRQLYERVNQRTRSLPLNVTITVMHRGERFGFDRPAPRGTPREEDTTAANWPEVVVEWHVFEWYPGHYIGDVGVDPRHDGRHLVAQDNLWSYIITDGREHFVSSVTEFLWAVIFHSATSALRQRRYLAAALGVMCRQGRHRSLGWTFLFACVLIWLGVDVEVSVDAGRLCRRRCASCQYDVDPRRLPGISQICGEIEAEIDELAQGVQSEVVRMHIIDDYVLHQEFFWDPIVPTIDLTGFD